MPVLDPGDPLARYRCSHGYLFLGCPHRDCPEQNAYLTDHEEALDAWMARRDAEVRRLVRRELGLPEEAMT